MAATWQRVDTMRWQKTGAPECRAAVETEEWMGPHVKCSLWRWAVLHGCLGRKLCDVHHTFGRLGCRTGQEEDGLGARPRGIPVITTIPRPRNGDCDFFVLFFLVARSPTFDFLFLLALMGVVERPEIHLVSMSSPRRTIPTHPKGQLPILL